MSDRVSEATQALVARFQRQRPVRSGSLLITLFGDSIAPRGGTITLGSLIRLAASFEIPERVVRTSVGRLAQEGWLAFRRSGRQSEYFLTDHGKNRFAEATQRIYGEAPQSWDGYWTLLLLPAGQRASRERLREEMSWLGFGQVGPGVLAHPSRSVEDTLSQLREIRLDGSSRAQASRMKPGRDVIVMRAASDGPEADKALLQAGWDLGELTRAYQRFVATFEPVESAVGAGRVSLPPQTAFIIRTLLIHEYRKIHLRDPLLPRSLLPADWVGARAYALCRDLYRQVFSAAEEHVAATASTLDGELRSPSRDTLRRFGGLTAE